jgi:surface antigen
VVSISQHVASAKVEIEDGYIVAACDATGSEWNTGGHGNRAHLRRLTHLLVMGAAVLPMSVTFAWAHPGGAVRARFEIQQPKSMLAALQDTGRGGAAPAFVVPDPPPAAAAAQAAAPAPPAPVPGGVGLHFPWGYCTWYVSTRRLIPWSGDAWSWYGAAIAMGYKVGPLPRPGAIMVSKEGPVGHVAYVESVDGSSFTVSEMNFRGFGIVDQRRIYLGGVALYGFIY